MIPSILVVDDDAHIREVIRFALEDAGMQVSEVENGQHALASIPRIKPDLIVLDIGMPHMDGFETCRELRKSSNLPVIFLTARDDEIDRVLGFQLGGDDYVHKPFSPRELVLRIRAILGRINGTQQTQIVHSYGDLHMDLSAHTCKLREAELHLTAIEFSVLATLAGNSDQVRSRNQLIEAVYGANSYLSGRTVDSHIRNIRQKALKIGYGDVIQTIHGVGVKLGSCRK